MAMCPKCFNHNKSMLAEHCPDCTHKTNVGDQIGFSLAVTFWTIVFIAVPIWLIWG